LTVFIIMSSYRIRRVTSTVLAEDPWRRIPDRMNAALVNVCRNRLQQPNVLFAVRCTKVAVIVACLR
jgi:hypothetical protein